MRRSATSDADTSTSTSTSTCGVRLSLRSLRQLGKRFADSIETLTQGCLDFLASLVIKEIERLIAARSRFDDEVDGLGVPFNKQPTFKRRNDVRFHLESGH